MVKSDSRELHAVNFLNEFAPVPPQTCALILETVARQAVSEQDLLRFVRPESLGLGAVEVVPAAIRLLKGLGLLNVTTETMQVASEVTSTMTNPEDFMHFRRLMSRTLIEDSNQAIARGGNPSDLVTYASYLLDSFSADEQVKSFDRHSNHANSIYGDVTLNSTRWNSLRRWMYALGWAENIAGRMQIDCTEALRCLGDELLGDDEVRELTADELITGLSLYIPIFSAAIRQWLDLKREREADKPGTITPSPAMIWSLRKMREIGLIGYRLIDDHRGLVFLIDGGRVSHFTFRRGTTNVSK